jgi:hypothetical protein
LLLRGGDLLATEDGSEVIEVIAAPESVSVVRCADPFLLARACYHLGNRHVPLQIMPGELRYHHDHVLDDMLRQFGLEVTYATCRLNRKRALTPAMPTAIATRTLIHIKDNHAQVFTSVTAGVFLPALIQAGMATVFRPGFSIR